MIIAIDPGEVHCGWAEFVYSEGKWRCSYAGEMEPKSLEDQMWRWASDPMNHVFVVEEFRLYPWKAARQGYSELKTVEVIGVIKWIAKRWGRKVVMQPAMAKAPTVGILKGKRIPLQSWGRGPHAKDAEVHGWYYILHTLDEKGESEKGE